MKFQLNDGGREAAGYKGTTGDCAVRAIAIATEEPYQKVYNALSSGNYYYAKNRRDRVAKKLQDKGSSPRNGNYREVFQKYLESIGWKWTPTMRIGQGCKVHLREEELPKGRLIVSVSKHMVAVIDGVINDTHNPDRGGMRCVYGYFTKEAL